MNRLPGRVLTVESSGGIALVEVGCGTLRLAALLLAADELPPPGTDVTLAFKETEVALAKELSGRISLRNVSRAASLASRKALFSRAWRSRSKGTPSRRSSPRGRRRTLSWHRDTRSRAS